MTTDSYYVDKPVQEQSSSSTDSGQELAQLETLRAFSILERAVSEIYTKNTASLAHLQSLARELQAATSSVPSQLRTVSSNTDGPEQRQVIRNAHVACSYYFIMMILTRPFLLSCIQQQCSSEGEGFSATDRERNAGDSATSAEITQGALASIDSAIHVIKLVYELLESDMLFNNMVLIM